MGSPEFAGMIRSMGGFAEYLAAVRDQPVDVDRWQVEKLALTGIAHELYFYAPGVRKDELGRLRAKAFDTLNAAVSAVLQGLPVKARVVLVPEGPYTFARAAAAANA